jgi:hypothetical protein
MKYDGLFLLDQKFIMEELEIFRRKKIFILK